MPALSTTTAAPSDTIPLCLYIHLPWCIRKCPYCDFNSHGVRDALPESAYLQALLADLEQDLAWVDNRPIDSVFIGGGTPSLFSTETIADLLAGLRARLTLSPDLEITLEANPGAVEQSKFREFRAVGINRLSIGVQSFNDEHLRRLGRIHGRREAFRAAEMAHGAGFDNFNLDLMFGLPGQSLTAAQADMANAMALEPTHISHYQLTLEPNTLFHKYPPADLPDEDQLWDMQIRCQRQLLEGGFSHYEVSAYARLPWRCQHNLNYWTFGDYLGIGAGAHGKLTDSSGRVHRLWKLKNPQNYMTHAGTPASIGANQQIPPAELPLEFMLNALRLVEGFPTMLFTTRTGLPMDEVAPVLNQARSQGLLNWNEERIQPTAQGLRFLNDVLERFLPENLYA